MPTKVWKAEIDDLKVEFINRWDFLLRSSETLLINGEVAVDVKKNFKSELQDSIAGTHTASKSVGNTSYDIEVKVSSKWPGLFLGCHIYVNGELVGGDTKSKLMYI